MSSFQVRHTSGPTMVQNWRSSVCSASRQQVRSELRVREELSDGQTAVSSWSYRWRREGRKKAFHFMASFLSLCLPPTGLNAVTPSFLNDQFGFLKASVHNLRKLISASHGLVQAPNCRMNVCNITAQSCNTSTSLSSVKAWIVTRPSTFPLLPPVAAGGADTREICCPTFVRALSSMEVLPGPT